MPINPRKQKSLFNGSQRNSFFSNNRAVQYLPTTETRYFRRLVKRNGTEGLNNVLEKFTETKFGN